jgi:hypothetical protein
MLPARVRAIAPIVGMSLTWLNREPANDVNRRQDGGHDLVCESVSIR